MESPLVRRRLAEQQRLRDIEYARKTLARRKELRQYQTDYNIVDRPLQEQLHDEIINLRKIDNNINTDRNTSGIHRSPSQPFISQEEYDAYKERKAKQEELRKRFNLINKFQNNDQPLDHKEYRIKWDDEKKGGKSRRKTHKRKQSKKIKKRNTKKNKRRYIKR
jgi:hypothetical protein